MSTTHHSQKSRSNDSITVQTLRERAGEMLRTADYLEAAQRLSGNPAGIRAAPRPMSLATRRKLSQAAKARAAAAKKGPTIVKKTA